MRLRLLILLGLALLAYPAYSQRYLEMIDAGVYTLQEIQQEAEAYFDIAGRGRGTGYNPFKRWEYVAQMELDKSGVKIPNNELSRRAREYRLAEKQRQATESLNSTGSWHQLGPTYKNATSSWNPGVGRITSIGLDPNNSSHIIVGSPTGGVWKTLDNCATWVPLADEFSTIDVYSLEISPYNSNIYLWGSTNGKIFRSINGGATWLSTSNVTGSGKVSRIQFHPTDPNVIYAVSESNGLFVSINSGGTWSPVSGASGVPGYDVEFKPGDPNTMYFSGISVYRSTNGGNSFSQINGFGTASNNYKRMSVSPANPAVVYVLESSGGKFGGFYKSTDSGASFSKLIDGSEINYFGYSETGDDDSGQAPRNMDIAANPSNAEEVHIGGVHTWKSIDGGESFFLTSYWVPGTAASLGVGYNHADINIIKFAGNTMYVSTDGGLYSSTDGAASFVDRTLGLGIREFYKIGVSKTNPNVVSGGAQDNGTSVMRGTDRTWVDWLGADGMESFVSWNNANNLYGTSQYGSMYRSTNQGTTRSSIPKPPDVEDGAWVTPFEQDPQISNTIYAAFADVWKTSNNGTLWTKISDFNNGNMNHMKLAPSSNQRIYVARGASLFTTSNGGSTWTTITSGWGTSTINFIAVHPQNPQRVLIVTASGVYHSTNAGSSWTSIGTGLPSGTKYCAAWENTGKNGIYVGGFGFVSYTNDDLNGQWIGFFDGLPNARVYELEINYVSNTIFACTYGRGLWESPLYQPLPPVSAFTADKREGCRSMSVTFRDQSANSPTAWEWTFENGTPSSSTLKNPVVSYSSSGTFNVKLKTTNASGTNTFEATDYIAIFDPAVPSVNGAERCDEGDVTLGATGQTGEQLRWYASAADTNLLFEGNLFTTNIAQTSTFYVAASTEYASAVQVGPVSNAIGNGSDHGGDQFLILDAQKPFRLKSALVYANGSADRTFLLKDASGVVINQVTVYVPDGENRITLDMDIPQGIGLQLGCASPANLYRNSSGAAYPYTIPGVMQIKSSTGGITYYYYLYDIEVETTALCESARVPVSAKVNKAPGAPVLSVMGQSVLCPGTLVPIVASNVCAGCTVHWSNGDTGDTLFVDTPGSYTAKVSDPINNSCGDSPNSNKVTITKDQLPDTPLISVSGATALCPGESVVLTVDNLCVGCAVYWSNGATGGNIAVSVEGIFTATLSNICGSGPASSEVAVSTHDFPTAPVISTSGQTELCPGESVVLNAGNLCDGCDIHWSTAETDTSITVSIGGVFAATASNLCGESPASNEIEVTTNTIPLAPTVSTSGPATLCPGETAILSIENVCAGCTVQWSTNETGPSITVASAGTYSAIVRNLCGESPVSNVIEINTTILPATPIVSASDTTALCPGESVVITAENVCGDCNVHWSNGETGASITVSAAGNYSATASNLCGESPASNMVSIAEVPLPGTAIVSASGPTALCPGESVVLTAENVCPGCLVDWSNGESGPSISVSAEGAYTASLRNECGVGLTSNTITVTVSTLPTTPSIAASGNTVLCPGESIILTAENLCPDCTLEWSTGENSPSILVSGAGIYEVIASNACGQSPASEPVQILMESLPDPAIIQASGPTELCYGDSVHLEVLNDVCFGCTVHWSNGATGLSTVISSSGVYTATVRDTANSFCGDSPVSNAIMVSIRPLFQPALQVANLCQLSAPPGSNYQWFVDGVLIPAATGPFWAAEVAGNYVVAMENPEGCPGTSDPVFAEACMSGVQNVPDKLFARIYPNPAQDQVFLEIQSEWATNLRLDLLSADGRLLGQLFENEILPGKQVFRVKLPELPAGIYQYRLATDKGSINGNLVIQPR